MQIDREQLLMELNTVKGGLSSKETIDQGTCFAFQNGEVMTFNDTVACRTESSLKITGAIVADKLLTMLDKWPEDTITFNRTKGRLNFKGKAKRGYFVTQDKINLPVKDIETPKKWKKMPEDFTEAIQLVQECACRAVESPHLSCINLTSKWVEACDGVQAGRYALDLPFIKKPVLIQKEAVRQVVKAFDSVAVAITENWVHFKDREGTLIVSCRTHPDEYPTKRLTKIFSGKGNPATLPKGLKGLVDRLQVFIDDTSGVRWLEVEITPDYMQVKSRGSCGGQTERKKIKYKGKPLKFSVSPQLFRDLTDKNDKCEITDRAIKVNKEDFQYVTSLWIPDEKEED